MIINKRRRLFLCLILLCNFIITGAAAATLQAFQVKTDSLDLYDRSRQRFIPVALYLPATDKKIKHQQLVLLSHGYNANKPGSNKSYSFLAENLAGNGYFVASIQHELPTDSLLPLTGVPQVVRKPNWDRGVENILFVLTALKKSHPSLDFKHVILIGHSNGGDMSMLFAQEYPDWVDKVISLDNRRVPLPRTNHPRIYSLRSSDQPADEAVLPTMEEQKKYRIKIVTLKNTIHNDMSDNANPAQRKEINDYILSFVNER